MRARLHHILMLLVAAILGCGAANPTPGSPPASFLNLTGNWEALANPNPSTPATLPSPIADFTGALQSTNGAVTGTLRAFDPRALTQAPCVPLAQDLPATGTLSATGDLVLTVPIAGGIATITATLSQTLQTFTAGSYQIIGGACAMPVSPMTIAQFAPATGTYTGTFNVLNLSSSPPAPVPGTAIVLNAVLTQSTTPNADGEFALSGTVTSTGACTATFTFTTGLVTGGGVGYRPPVPPGAPAVDFNGAITPTASTFTGAFAPLAVCNSPIFEGTLTRQ